MGRIGKFYKRRLYGLKGTREIQDNCRDQRKKKRFEIEKMYFKTEEVKKRMSLVTGDSENVLNSTIIDSFIN